jgi:hypothetical protein
MALSEDQRAMLRLLAQREQGYDDLAALMGLSVEEVRARVKDALEAMEEGEAAPPLPPEPPAPTPAPAPPAEPEKPVVAEEPPPTPPPAPKPAASAAKRPPSSRPRISMPSGQGARAAIAAGVAVVVLVIVVLAVSGDSGSDPSSGSPSAPAAATTETAANSAAGKQVTQAVLSPVDGSDASGAATFGRLKNTLALQVEAEGLAPTEKGQSYTIWLADSPQKMLPLASTQTSKDGKIAAQFEVPTEVLAYLASETFDQIDVTLTTDSALKASLKKATGEKKAPIYTGTDVLRGTVTGPIVGAAKTKK